MGTDEFGSRIWTQELFFGYLVDLISRLNRQPDAIIRMYGIDTEFLNYKTFLSDRRGKVSYQSISEYIRQEMSVSKWASKHFSNSYRPIEVHAIIPSRSKGDLDDLICQEEGFNVKYVDQKIPSGFAILGSIAAYIWDQGRKSPHPAKSQENAMYRRIISPNSLLGSLKIKQLHKSFADTQSNYSVQRS